MKRMAVLRHGVCRATSALLQRIREKLLPMLRAQADCYRKTIVPGACHSTEFCCAAGTN